jgi:hypothetical protein
MFAGQHVRIGAARQVALLRYNSLGHDALSPARCAKPRPALRLTTGRVGALTYSSNRASNGIQVDQGVARKA